jgi:hypothetical protein
LIPGLALALPLAGNLVAVGSATYPSRRWVFIGLVLAFSLIALLKVSRPRRESRLALKQAGQHILQTRGRGALLVSSDPVISFYARARHRDCPSTLELLKDVGRGADAVAIDLARLTQFEPGFLNWLDQEWVCERDFGRVRLYRP